MMLSGQVMSIPGVLIALADCRRQLNMSTLGHNLLPTPTTTKGPTQTSSGLGGLFSSVLKNITDTIDGGLNSIGNDIADKLAHELGIQQWYSLHLMDACEGNFAPNASTVGAWFNVTNCTAQKPGSKLNALFRADLSSLELTVAFR
jgi:hypothetical protein